MKKNVIFITVDSLCADYIYSKYGKMAMPFLFSLNHTLQCENLFSQGPFTEAGTKALLTGCNVLDDTGYMNRINDAVSNIYKVFHENGYETHALIYPDFLFGKKLRENIDFLYPTSRFSFKNLWDYKISYYSKLMSDEILMPSQIDDLIAFVELLFDCWLHFLKHNKDCEYEIISDKADKTYYSNNFDLLSKEYDLFQKDSEKYVVDLLKNKEQHVLFKIDTIDLNSDIDNDLFRKFIIVENKKFIKKCKKIHLSANKNKINASEKICGLLSLLRSGFKIPDNKYGVYLMDLLIGNDFSKVENICSKKLVASCRKQFDFIRQIIIQRNTEQPLLITAHVEEPHYFNIYYSFDCNNLDYLKEEFSIQKEFISKIEKDFDGSLEYFMSLRYVDHCIEDLFSFLKERRLLEKYQIIITADHGSSYNFSPIRDNLVNNFHLENYHIPLFVFDTSLKKQTCCNFYTSKDILFSLYCYNNFLFSSVNGRNMFEDKKNTDENYALIEYMGPGCPDMRVRDAWMAVRSNDYLISVKCPFTRKVTKSDIYEIYFLGDDKLEQRNLVSQIDTLNIDQLFKIIQDRHDNIRKKWCKNG